MGSFSVLRDRLEQGVCDVVFSLGFDLAAYEGVEHMICYRPRPLLVFPASHPLASRADCAVSDFADDIFLLPDPAECFGRGNILKEILARFGIPDAKVGYVRNSESVLLGVLVGRGVAILTACHRCTADTRYRTIPIPDDGAQPTPAVVAIWKKDNANPIIPAFLQTLEDLTRSDNLI